MFRHRTLNLIEISSRKHFAAHPCDLQEIEVDKTEQTDRTNFVRLRVQKDLSVYLSVGL
jgi:hypothetical protein